MSVGICGDLSQCSLSFIRLHVSLLITLDIDCIIQSPFQIYCDFVQLYECLDDILCILLFNILN